MVGTQTLCLAAWFGGEDTDSKLLGENTDTTSSGSDEPSHRGDFGYCQLCLYNVSHYLTAGPSEVFPYTKSSFTKYNL